RANCMPLDPAIRVLSRSKNAAARCKPSPGFVLGRSALSRTTSALPAPTSLRPRHARFSRAESSNFDHDRVALAPARADRGDAEATAATAQLVHERADDASAGGGDRVAGGDRAAVDVDLVLVDAEHPHRVEGDRGEGLVDLPEI